MRPRVVRLSGKVTDFSFLHSRKAPLPTLVRVSGRSMDSMAVARKHSAPMLVRPLGRVTSVSAEAP